MCAATAEGSLCTIEGVSRDELLARLVADRETLGLLDQINELLERPNLDDPLVAPETMNAVEMQIVASHDQARVSSNEKSARALEALRAEAAILRHMMRLASDDPASEPSDESRAFRRALNWTIFHEFEAMHYTYSTHRDLSFLGMARRALSSSNLRLHERWHLQRDRRRVLDSATMRRALHQSFTAGTVPVLAIGEVPDGAWRDLADLAKRAARATAQEYGLSYDEDAEESGARGLTSASS